MDEPYDISTGKLVAIGLKEIGKEIPGLKSVIGTHTAVFAAIEKKRVEGTLRELLQRVSKVEDWVRKPNRAATLIYGCDQARHDILSESKAKEYGGVIGYLMQNDVELSDVMEVLDNLRKLSANDLKVLFSFRTDTEILERRTVRELAGISPFLRDQVEHSEIRTKTERIFPSLMRLQGIGVLYVPPPDIGEAKWGGRPPGTAPLVGTLNQSAYLTESGKRLIQALPH